MAALSTTQLVTRSFSSLPDFMSSITLFCNVWEHLKHNLLGGCSVLPRLLLHIHQLPVGSISFLTNLLKRYRLPTNFWFDGFLSTQLSPRAVWILPPPCILLHSNLPEQSSHLKHLSKTSFLFVLLF